MCTGKFISTISSSNCLQTNCAIPVLKVISHFAWNCMEYILCRAYEIEKALWKKNTVKLSINHKEFWGQLWFIVSLILCKGFCVMQKYFEPSVIYINMTCIKCVTFTQNKLPISKVIFYFNKYEGCLFFFSNFSARHEKI